MIYSENNKTNRFDYEIKKGFSGKGEARYWIYWHDSLKYNGSVSIEGEFKSISEALLNVKYNLYAGENIGCLQ